MDRDRAIDILRDMALPEYGHPMDEHQAAKAGADALVRLHSIEQELAEAREVLKRIGVKADRQLFKECNGDAIVLVKITTECAHALARIDAALGRKP